MPLIQQLQEFLGRSLQRQQTVMVMKMYHAGIALLAALMFAYMVSADLGHDEPSRYDSTDDFDSQTESVNDMTDSDLDDLWTSDAPENEHMQEVTEQASGKVITHGSTVALQVLYMKMNYFSCRGTFCNKQSCGNLYMEGADWKNCYGEVFEINRRAGSGVVKVGEDIALYYPREPGKWLGCAGKRCGKATCPGRHSCTSGFASPSKWNQCWGEVFKIYVRGKRIGAPVRSNDHIMLYFPRHRNWIGVPSAYADHRTCPGRSLPPPANLYDRCWGEIFELVAQ